MKFLKITEHLGNKKLSQGTSKMVVMDDVEGG